MPKPTLLQASGNSYYFTERYSVGAYVTQDKKVILFDSGIDKSAAKEIDEALKNKGLIVAAIVNSHSHADHCGGNNYFQTQYPNIEIYATQWERAYIEQPEMEPTCFCGGAEPFMDLRNKYLQADPSIVTHVIREYKDQTITILNIPFEMVALPGHTPGMIGIVTPDNVLYCGDAFFSGETFEKHAVLFYTNIADTIQSLQKLKNMQFTSSVLYHGGATQNITLLLDQHIAKINKITHLIHTMIAKAEHTSIDELTQQIMKHFSITAHAVGFTLTRTCVNAYVTHLQKSKMIQLTMVNGLLGTISIAPPAADVQHTSHQTSLHALQSDIIDREEKHTTLTIRSRM